nr:SpaA isopeptide-forming pilin-related protein [Bifidobacterium amazonense]
MIAAVKKSGVAGPYNVDYYPTLCSATTDEDGKVTFDSGYKAGRCWAPTFKDYSATKTNGIVTVSFTSVTLSAVVIDDTGTGTTYVGFDNNPVGGGFDLNNLAPGTYTVKERVSPTGYALNTNEYKFQIISGPAKWIPLVSDGVTQDTDKGFTDTDINIPDEVLPGVSWSKIDANTGAKLAYSEWTVTKYVQGGDGEDILDTKSRWIVQDCVKVTDKDIDCANQKNKGEYLADHSNDVGKFNISGLDPGKYLLQETVIPEGGYWNPEEGDRYEFTIPEANADKTQTVVPLTKIGTKTTVTDITNTLPQIAWKKTAKDSGAILDQEATEWTITGPVAVLVDADNGAATDAPVDLESVTATVVDCLSKQSSTNPCDSQATGLQTADETDGDATKQYYNDLDNAMGQLRVSGLQRPTDKQAEQGIRYQYVLKETKAPSGYLKSPKEYVFNIGARKSESSLDLDEACVKSVGGTNCIPNAKATDVLPLTGGWDDRDWMWVGGGFVAAAALVLALSNEYRRRKAVIA